MSGSQAQVIIQFCVEGYNHGGFGIVHFGKSPCFNCILQNSGGFICWCTDVIVCRSTNVILSDGSRGGAMAHPYF